MTIPNLKERIEYARDELAWLEKGAPEGEEPWRGWEALWHEEKGWGALLANPEWHCGNKYRRRPKMLHAIHAIDAKGKRWEFPEPMREAPQYGDAYWQVSTVYNEVVKCTWNNSPNDNLRLAAGLCQSTEEGAQQQLAALRAVCLGGVE